MPQDNIFLRFQTKSVKIIEVIQKDFVAKTFLLQFIKNGWSVPTNNPAYDPYAGRGKKACFPGPSAASSSGESMFINKNKFVRFSQQRRWYCFLSEETFLILIRAQIRALLWASKSKFILNLDGSRQKKPASKCPKGRSP
jgi:hypothetical protein